MCQIVPMDIEEERTCLLRCQNGDLHEFSRLIEQHKQYVFRICYSMLGYHQEDAEDVSQEVFMKCYEKISEFRMQSKFTTWLYSITKNICLNRMRRLKPNTSIEETNGVMPKDTSTEDCVRQKLEQISEDHREVIIHIFFNDLSYEETAEILQSPIGTIKSRRDRALKTLMPLVRECL